MPPAAAHIEPVRPARLGAPGLTRGSDAPRAASGRPRPGAVRARRLIAAAGLAVGLAGGLFAGPAAAECGTGDAPCAVGGAFGDGAYHVLTPPGDGPFPGAMVLHGYGGQAAVVMRTPVMVEALLARGYAVIAPQGAARREGDKGGAWNAFGAEERRDDVAFLNAVAADAASRFRIDRGRMMLAGFSGGGMMTWRVACAAPASFAAYAPIAGLLWRPLPESCAGPVRLFHIHGWSDPVVPLEGRAVAGGRVVQGDLFRGLDLLRETNGCEGDDPDGFLVEGPFMIRRWTDCAPGSALEFALHHGGHLAPAGWGDLVADWFEALGIEPS